jgi:hypothetical protein
MQLALHFLHSPGDIVRSFSALLGIGLFIVVVLVTFLAVKRREERKRLKRRAKKDDF